VEKHARPRKARRETIAYVTVLNARNEGEVYGGEYSRGHGLI
jgi:hypothetical protein